MALLVESRQRQRQRFDGSLEGAYHHHLLGSGLHNFTMADLHSQVLKKQSSSSSSSSSRWVPDDETVSSDDETQSVNDVFQNEEDLQPPFRSKRGQKVGRSMKPSPYLKESSPSSLPPVKKRKQDHTSKKPDLLHLFRKVGPLFLPFLTFRERFCLRHVITTSSRHGLEQTIRDEVLFRDVGPELDLSGTNVSEQSLLFLYSMRQLTGLDLSKCKGLKNIKSEMKPVASLDKLQTLSLRGTKAGSKSLEALRSIKESLISLDLSGLSITDQGMEQVGKLCELTRLDLSWNNSVTNDGLKHLSGLRLERLNLAGSHHITDAGLVHLRDLPLTDLDLSCISISDHGLSHLRNLTSLRKLKLSSSQHITNRGLECLSGLNNLAHLDLSKCNRITDKGLRHLEDLRLESCCLEGCSLISDPALSYRRLGVSDPRTAGLHPCVPPASLSHSRSLETSSVTGLGKCPSPPPNLQLFKKEVEIQYRQVIEVLLEVVFPTDPKMWGRDPLHVATLSEKPNLDLCKSAVRSLCQNNNFSIFRVGRLAFSVAPFCFLFFSLCVVLVVRQRAGAALSPDSEAAALPYGVHSCTLYLRSCPFHTFSPSLP